jgi:hypothetical protein
LFLDGERKYSYHWQNSNMKLIYRWDNAKHHTHIATFPFHKHTPNGIEESIPMTLKKVLEIIDRSISI